MAYLVLLPEPFHSEHKALDRKTVTGAVEFNVPAIEVYVSPPGVFSTGPLLSCLLIVLVTTARLRYFSSELESLEYRIQPCRQGFVYRLRNVGWIEAWVHIRLDPPDCHVLLPYCYPKTGKTFGDPPLLLPPCPTDPRRSDRTAITVWRSPLFIAALPNRSTPERQNCDNIDLMSGAASCSEAALHQSNQLNLSREKLDLFKDNLECWYKVIKQIKEGNKKKLYLKFFPLFFQILYYPYKNTVVCTGRDAD
uniref:Uncharacterized protein n=1 Tax=Glossina palpalis gambiensis TaxID=67801 RepID=A0A1B0BQG3_9MUSC